VTNETEKRSIGAEASPVSVPRRGGEPAGKWLKLLSWALVLLGVIHVEKAGATGAQSYTVPTRDGLLPTDGVASNSHMATDGQGTVYVAWNDSSTAVEGRSLIVVSRSLDNGVSWGPAIRLNYLPQISGAQQPHLACDQAGHAYVVWLDLTVLRFVSTSDWGETWTNPEVEISVERTTSKMRPKMACDNAGNVVVGWEASDTQGEIHARSSHDFGASWDSDVAVLTPGNEEFHTAESLLTNGLGTFYMTWTGNTSLTTPAQPQSATSHDGGRTWEPRVFADGGTSLGAHQGAAAADSFGGLYFCWLEQIQESSPTQGMFVSASADAGASYDPQRLLLSDPNAPPWVDQHSIACDELGNVYVVWEAVYDPYSHVHLNRSRDGGRTWLPAPIRVDHSPAGTADVSVCASSNGHVYVVWQDGRSGVDIFFNYSTDFGETFQPIDIRVDDPSRVDRFTTDVQILGDNRGYVHFSWDEAFSRPNVLYNRATPRLAIGLYPELGPAVVPAQGARVPVAAFVANGGTGPLPGLTAWIDATLPSGRTTRPAIGPFSFSLPAGREKTKPISLRIPARLPAGLYQVHLRVDGPVCDRATMPFMKLP